MSTAAVQTPLAPQRPRAILPRRAHLGLDLGTHMGYAALDDTSAVIDAGVWDFSPTDKERRTDPGRRWVRVANQIGEWFAALRLKYTFGSVAYETVHRHEGVAAAHVFGGMEAMLLAQLSRFGLAVERVEVAHLKLIATSKGNAGKQAIMVAARSRWGGRFAIDIDAAHADNMCDALFVAEMQRRRTLGVVL